MGADSNCSSTSSRRRKYAWGKFCETFSLEIFRVSAPTFHHHNGSSESNIDYFLTHSCNITNLVLFCTLDTPYNLSSHDPLFATFQVLKERENSSANYSHTYSDFHRRKVTWESSKVQDYKDATDVALSQAEEYWNFPEAIPHLCSLYSNLLINIAENTMDYKEITRRAKNGLIHSKKIETAKRRLQSSFQRWKKAGNLRDKLHPARACYLSAKAEFQRLT